MNITLTMDEIAVIVDLIHDWGWEYSLKADREEVKKLALKVGIDPTWTERML